MKYAVVGGGIVGLACARQAQLAGHEVVVYEAEDTVARGQTGRNSGVVHAGLYYEPGSLKARLCRRGVELLKTYCRRNNLPYVECGKLLVATDAREAERLDAIAERATANGVPRLRMVEPEAVEPNVRGVAGLHSPTTAITDFGAVARKLAEELEVRTSTQVRDIGELAADRVFVCAGLGTDALVPARGPGPLAGLRVLAVRGAYWRTDRRLVRGLVYPVPDPALPYLGAHFTPTIGGEVLVGPTAGDDDPRAALALVPALALEDLSPAWAGERAQAVDADGRPLLDFLFVRGRRITWVCNAPSPAATAAFAIAEELVD